MNMTWKIVYANNTFDTLLYKNIVLFRFILKLLINFFEKEGSITKMKNTYLINVFLFDRSINRKMKSNIHTRAVATYRAHNNGSCCEFSPWEVLFDAKMYNSDPLVEEAPVVIVNVKNNIEGFYKCETSCKNV